MTAKDDAEARKAAAEAEAAELDIEERKSALGQQKREAETRAAIAKADKDAAESRQAQFNDYVPDLSKLERGETTVAGTEGIYASALALKALDAAATEAAKQIKRKLGDNYRVLLTTDPDFVTSDAAFLETRSGLAELHDAAEKLHKEPESPMVNNLVAASAAIGVASAVASAVPSVISLFSSHRNISGQAIAGNDLFAMMRLGSALAEGDPGATVLIDDFRVLSDGEIAAALAKVRTDRQVLIEHKLELTAASKPKESTMIGLIDGLISIIDAYLVAIFKVPDGSKRSAYTNAVLREEMHNGEIGSVILVKGAAGSAQQLVDDRPLFFEDKFSTIASMGVSYVIVNTSDGKVRGGGISSASRAISGSVGSRFVIDSVATPEFE